MSRKEELISNIRAQREKLAALIRYLDASTKIGPAESALYEATAKEVENNLKRLCKPAAGKFS